MGSMDPIVTFHSLVQGSKFPEKGVGGKEHSQGQAWDAMRYKAFLPIFGSLTDTPQQHTTVTERS